MQLKIRIEKRGGRVQVYEANAKEGKLFINLQRRDRFFDEFFKALDEIPVMNARAVVHGVWVVAAAVANIEIDGFETAPATEFYAGPTGVLEEAMTYAACVGERFKLGTKTAEVKANVVGLIKIAPLFESIGLFRIKSFEGDVEMDDGRGEMSENCTDGLIGFCFRFGVIAMPFAKIGECERQAMKVRGLTYNVPGAFENQGMNPCMLW